MRANACSHSATTVATIAETPMNKGIQTDSVSMGAKPMFNSLSVCIPLFIGDRRDLSPLSGAGQAQDGPSGLAHRRPVDLLSGPAGQGGPGLPMEGAE